MRGPSKPARQSIVSAPLTTSLAAIAAALLLASCGGSSGSSGVQLSGVAATGAPMAGAAITVTCANGSSYNATASAGGAWTADIQTSAILPCVVKATGGTPPVTLYSMATTPGTINVTPLTNLVVASAAGADPADWIAANAGSKLQAALAAAAAKLPAAETAVTASLQSAGFAVPSGGLLTASFTPKDGDPLDDLLEAVNKSLAASGTTYDEFVDKVAAAGTTPVTVPKLDVITAAQVLAQPRLNGGKVTVASGVATMETTADSNAVGAYVGGGNGNKSVLQIPGLNGMKLKDLKQIVLDLKPLTAIGTDTQTNATLPYVYVNLVVDMDCSAAPLPASATIQQARERRRLVIYDPFYKFIQEQPTYFSASDFKTLTVTPATGGWRISPGAATDTDTGVEETAHGSQYTLTPFRHDLFPNACIVDNVPSADGGLYRDTSKSECVSTSGLATTAPAACGKAHAGLLLNLGDSGTNRVSKWQVRKVMVNERVFTFE